MRVSQHENTETLYIELGERNCKIFSLPYRLPTGQLPWAIHPIYQNTWKEIGVLGENGVLVEISPKYASFLREELLIPGAYFEVSHPPKARVTSRLTPAGGMTL